VFFGVVWLPTTNHQLDSKIGYRYTLLLSKISISLSLV